MKDQRIRVGLWVADCTDLHGQHDWVMSCEWHRTDIWASCWEDAYEAAVGHAAMWHRTLGQKGTENGTVLPRDLRVSPATPSIN